MGDLLQGCALIAGGLNGHLYAATVGRNGHAARGIAAANGLSGHQCLPLSGHQRGGLIGFRNVDGYIVVGGIAVASGTHALRHALAAVEAGATSDRAGTRRKGAAVAVLLDRLHIKFGSNRCCLKLHRGGCPDQISAGIAPGTAHDNAEADNPPRHDITTTQLGELLVLDLYGFESCIGVARCARCQAGGGQPV
ncbi:hypothetical protein D3C87_965990 [compost metagenome]